MSENRKNPGDKIVLFPGVRRVRRARKLTLARLVWWVIVIFLIWSIGSVLLFRFVPVPVTATMLLDGNGITKDWTPLSRIDRNMVSAVIAAEDGKFCLHDGFDREAIEKAMERNARAERNGGRIVDQPANRQECLPVAGRRLCPQGTGGMVHRADRTIMGQATDHGGLSQCRRNRHRHIWS